MKEGDSEEDYERGLIHKIMAKNLVIVESPAKGKTIEKYLGKDYKVVASMGHIRDLPTKSLGIDIENNFTPEYQVSEEKTKTVASLKKLAKSAENIILATDEDREGEAIAWHLAHIFEIDPATAQRVTYHEITKSAIQKAFESPRKIHLNLVDAQQARRLLDRLVGYKVSPVLWKKIRKGLSAGRVQSVAVKLIVEKEREIQAFKAEESWKMSAELEFDGKKFRAEFSKIDGKIKKLRSKADAQKIFASLMNDITSLKEGKSKKDTLTLTANITLDFKLSEIIKKDSVRKPGAPFTTSTLQQEGARKFGFGVKQTMMIAQKLYEGMDLGDGERQGLITYMRTDSLNLSDQALSEAQAVIEKNFWKDYHERRKYKSKSAGAQEAHEAIRPADLSRTPESLEKFLDAQQLKLYTLIWKRTLASQMSDAIVEVTTYDFSPVKNPSQTWISKGEVIKFDGFMKLYIEGNDEESEDEDTGMLPNIPQNSVLAARDILALQSFSRPPARYTEASLVKKLEGEGIGRPSTYAPTISTIIERGYIEKLDRKYLHPTETAFTVTDFLEEYFSQMMQYQFTKSVEEEFDEIANGKEKYQNMLSKFWEGTLKKNIEEAWEKAEKIIEKVGEKCPECGEELIFRHSRAGKFIWCSGYPECKYTDQPKEEKDALSALRTKYEGKPCPEGIEGTIVVKTGRFGPFLASSEYPRVKWIGKIKSEKDELLEAILESQWLLVDEESWEKMVVKNSRRGPFLAAANYPDVKIAKNIPKEVWNELNERLKATEEESENQEEV
jgi:DNA topoisomerase-1